MTPDPSKSSGGPSDPQSWNRYAYVGGGPINRLDPTGQIWEITCGGFGDDGEGSASDDCGFIGFNQGCSSVYIMAAIDGMQMPSPCDFLPLPVLPPISSPGCGVAGGLSSDQLKAVDAVLGENSWYLIGQKAYEPGDAQGSPSGPNITASTVYTEDKDMFSVFENRTQTKGFPSTIGAVASQSGQFLGYSAGMAKYNAALTSPIGSSLCNDLTDDVDALAFVLSNGSQLPGSYLYWKAINQGKIGFHKHRPGDIYVANTAFGTVN
jgi:hypothetical protein